MVTTKLTSAFACCERTGERSPGLVARLLKQLLERGSFTESARWLRENDTQLHKAAMIVVEHHAGNQDACSAKQCRLPRMILHGRDINLRGRKRACEQLGDSIGASMSQPGSHGISAKRIDAHGKKVPFAQASANTHTLIIMLGDMHKKSCIPLTQRWASIRDAASYSGLAERTIEILIRDNLIRSACPKRKGASRGRRLIDLRSLDEWIESGIGGKSDLPKLQEGARQRRAK